MCQEGQHGCEGTQSSSKENKEGKLLLWVNRDLMESCREDQREYQGWDTMHSQGISVCGMDSSELWLKPVANEKGRALE